MTTAHIITAPDQEALNNALNSVLLKGSREGDRTAIVVNDNHYNEPETKESLLVIERPAGYSKNTLSQIIRIRPDTIAFNNWESTYASAPEEFTIERLLRILETGHNVIVALNSTTVPSSDVEYLHTLMTPVASTVTHIDIQ